MFSRGQGMLGPTPALTRAERSEGSPAGGGAVALNSLLGDSDEGPNPDPAEDTNYTCSRISAENLSHCVLSHGAHPPSPFAENLRRARC